MHSWCMSFVIRVCVIGLPMPRLWRLRKQTVILKIVDLDEIITNSICQPENIDSIMPSNVAEVFCLIQKKYPKVESSYKNLTVLGLEQAITSLCHVDSRRHLQFSSNSRLEIDWIRIEVEIRFHQQLEIITISCDEEET